MTKFFNIFKKSVFGQFLVYLQNFQGKTSSGFLPPYQNLEKTNDTIPGKHPDSWKDRQTLFYRTLPATAGGPKN